MRSPRGPRNAVVLSSGFAEAGEEGKAAQEALVGLASRVGSGDPRAEHVGVPQRRRRGHAASPLVAWAAAEGSRQPGVAERRAERRDAELLRLASHRCEQGGQRGERSGGRRVGRHPLSRRGRRHDGDRGVPRGDPSSGRVHRRVAPGAGELEAGSDPQGRPQRGDRPGRRLPTLVPSSATTA